jgi:hypothetical protein
MDTKEILSYKEFLILCVTGPVLIFGIYAISSHFPKLVSPHYYFELALSLQGCVATYFIFKRDPEMYSDVGDQRYVLFAKSLLVFCTTIGSILIVVVPIYVLYIVFAHL